MASLKIADLKFYCFTSTECGSRSKKSAVPIPNDVKTYESASKWISKKCEIEPLPSYLFGLCEYKKDNNDNSFYHLDPSENFTVQEAEYRLLVLPDSVDRLAEISSKGLNQLFFSAKFDLFENRLKLKNGPQMQETLRNLLCYDLCRMLKNRLPDITSPVASVESLFQTELHVKLVEEYSQLEAFSSDTSWFTRFASKLINVNKRFAERLKKLIIKNWENLRTQTEVDFTVDYLKEIDRICSNFLRNSYGIEKCLEENENGVYDDSQCTSVELSCKGLFLVNNREDSTLWTNHHSLSNFVDLQSLQQRLQIQLQPQQIELGMLLETEENKIVIIFKNAKDKKSFDVELFNYRRIFKNFSSPHRFPSQIHQFSNKIFGPLCDGNESDEIRCATSMLSEHRTCNAIAFESVKNHDDIFVIVKVDENQSKFFLINRSNDGYFTLNYPTNPNRFISITDLLRKEIPTPLNFYFNPEETLPPFKQDSDPKIFYTTPKIYIHGKFNIMSRGTFEKDKIIKTVLIKRVRAEYKKDEIVLKRLKRAEEFLTRCHLRPFIREMFHCGWSMSVNSERFLVLKFYPYDLKEYLQKNIERLNIRFLIKACRSLCKAVLFLKTIKIVHGEINCRNLLYDKNSNSVVLAEPSQRNIKPWIPSTGSRDSHKNDIYAMGTTIWEILNFGYMPESIDDPYLLPAPKGCLVSSYETNKFGRPVIYELRSLLYVGFQLHMLAADCWRTQTLQVDTILTRLETEMSYLKIAGDKISNITIGEEDSLVINGEFGDPLIVRRDTSLRGWRSEGNFGEVFQVFDVSNPENIFALKRLKDPRSMDSLLIEIQTMMHCNHDNILQCKGYTIDERNGNKISGILMPVMENSSLKHYITKKRNHGRSIPLQQRIKFCKQIAEGMEYLNVVMEITHYDLALRNVLLSENLTVKIADFGLCKLDQDRVYAYTSGSISFTMPPEYRLPPEWTRPEVQSGRIQFDRRGDVWCFGFTIRDMETRLQEMNPILMNWSEQCMVDDLNQRPYWNDIIHWCDDKLN